MGGLKVAGQKMARLGLFGLAYYLTGAWVIVPLAVFLYRFFGGWGGLVAFVMVGGLSAVLASWLVLSRGLDDQVQSEVEVRLSGTKLGNWALRSVRSPVTLLVVGGWFGPLLTPFIYAWLRVPRSWWLPMIALSTLLYCAIWYAIYGVGVSVGFDRLTG